MVLLMKTADFIQFDMCPVRPVGVQVN